MVVSSIGAAQTYTAARRWAQAHRRAKSMRSREARARSPLDGDQVELTGPSRIIKKNAVFPRRRSDTTRR
jgi:hypothetical protein